MDQTFDFLILKLNMHERRNCTGWNSQGYSLLRWRQWQGYMSGKNYKALFTQLALVIFMQQCRLTYFLRVIRAELWFVEFIHLVRHNARSSARGSTCKVTFYNLITYVTIS